MNCPGHCVSVITADAVQLPVQLVRPGSGGKLGPQGRRNKLRPTSLSSGKPPGGRAGQQASGSPIDATGLGLVAGAGGGNWRR